MAGETLVALCQGVCIVVFAVVIGVSMTLGQVGALIGPSLACCLLGAAFGLAALAALPNQRSAMQVFEFLILPQYVLAGVLVPLRGLPAWLGALSWAMPLGVRGRLDPGRLLRRLTGLSEGRDRQPVR
jgi:ABC-2 type transport system permease protein